MGTATRIPVLNLRVSSNLLAALQQSGRFIVMVGLYRYNIKYT
jgi:hypothetical protein